MAHGGNHAPSCARDVRLSGDVKSCAPRTVATSQPSGSRALTAHHWHPVGTNETVRLRTAGASLAPLSLAQKSCATAHYREPLHRLVGTKEQCNPRTASPHCTASTPHGTHLPHLPLRSASHVCGLPPALPGSAMCWDFYHSRADTAGTHGFAWRAMFRDIVSLHACRS